MPKTCNLFPTSIYLHFLLLLLPLMTLSAKPAENRLLPTELQEQSTRELFVSPSGSNDGNGTREEPLATVAEALKRLPDGGRIVLLGGTYHEFVEIPSSKEDAGRLTVKAAAGESVVFDGGARVEKWERVPNQTGVYIVHAPGRKTMYPSEVEYFDLWEQEARVRYRKVVDAPAVYAWAGSVFSMGEGRLLVHTSNGDNPETVALWMNQKPVGIRINRKNVTIEGLHFQNYVGGKEARALSIGASHAIIRNCEFTNCTIGISCSGDYAEIMHCNFREVGLGIRQQRCIDMTVRYCFIESAVGRFAFNDLSEHYRDGIRIYHPGDGATIEGCVTSGFWAGLYIKTISFKEGSRPYIIRNNTFLDGIRSGADHLQPRSYYTANIVGPAKGDGVQPNGAYLKKMGATLERNYFYGEEGTAYGSNLAGPQPFRSLADGDLELDPTLVYPDPAIGSSIRKVRWSPRMAKFLFEERVEERPLNFAATPTVTASEKGAIIVATFTSPAKANLRYRKIGGSKWHIRKAFDITIYPPKNLRAAAPIEVAPPEKYTLLFPLVNGELEPGATYEYKIEATGTKGEEIQSAVVQFSAVGGPKSILASPPLGLQDALNQALPGDTVLLEEGVYTRPVMLMHGGIAEAPLIIRGKGWKHTILDGGKEATNMLTLSRANHVSISGLQIRWYGDAAVKVNDSSNGSFEECWIYNASPALGTRRSGLGLFLTKSPEWTIRRCLFTHAENGLIAVESPRLTLENNTAYGNLYAGFYLKNSCKDSRIVRNSLNFTGNNSLRIQEDDPEAFASLVCDFNNYGTRLRQEAPSRPENDFIPAARYGHLAMAKQIIAVELGKKKSTLFFQMKEWQKFSGKDEHSVFADPQFVAPAAGDFRLFPESPNILGENQVIGAEAVMQ